MTNEYPLSYGSNTSIVRVAFSVFAYEQDHIVRSIDWLLRYI